MGVTQLAGCVGIPDADVQSAIRRWRMVASHVQLNQINTSHTSD
jgi:hypothetical protein